MVGTVSAATSGQDAQARPGLVTIESNGHAVVIGTRRAANSLIRSSRTLSTKRLLRGNKEQDFHAGPACRRRWAAISRWAFRSPPYWPRKGV